jgi:Putative MetA-pathway of phenol degradation
MHPPPLRPSAQVLALLAGAAILAPALPAGGQEIEPRAFSNAPVGVNFLVGGYAFTSGSLSTDPAVPVRNAQLETSSGVLAYVRAIDLWGMSAKVDAILPYTRLSGTADFAGRQIERKVDGFGDARFRLSVNFYGAPALTPQEFTAYRQDLIIGASLQVSAPTGQYDPSRVVNLGTNRWSLRPEIGASKALGRLTLELAAGATVYTENTNFLGGNRRSEDPIYGLQSHVIYNFRSGIWASADVTWFTGGRTSINGERNSDLQRNWRLGATVSVPLSERYSLRFSGSGGVAARTGNNYTLVGVALQYRWGGGL